METSHSEGQVLRSKRAVHYKDPLKFFDEIWFRETYDL